MLSFFFFNRRRSLKQKAGRFFFANSCLSISIGGLSTVRFSKNLFLKYCYFFEVLVHQRPFLLRNPLSQVTLKVPFIFRFLSCLNKSNYSFFIFRIKYLTNCSSFTNVQIFSANSFLSFVDCSFDLFRNQHGH